MKILVMLGSSRRNGNSETLAEKAILNVPATKLYLSDLPVTPIVDRRHTDPGFAPLPYEYAHLIKLLIAHDVLLFVTPLYWYGMSGAMKNFIDLWSHAMRDKRFNFRQEMQGKEVYLLVTGSDSPHEKATPLIAQFAHICSFMGMRLAGSIVGEGNRPGEVLQDHQALAEVAALNRTLAERLIPASDAMIPPVTLRTATNEPLNLRSVSDDHHLVLFFYPGDGEGLRYPELRGCTAEACAFRDSLSLFAQSGAKVFGVSLQPTARQAEFVQREHLTFDLLSDEERILTNALDIPCWDAPDGQTFVTRTTVIVSKGGRIHRILPVPKLEGHIETVLEELRRLT